MLGWHANVTIERLEWRFVIDGYTRETLPLFRLAQYMTELANLMGQHDHIRLGTIEAGSAEFVMLVPIEADQLVRERCLASRDQNAPRDVHHALIRINQLMDEDNITGSLQDSGKNLIVKFNSKSSQDQLTIGPIYQSGELDGRLIRVGGSAEEVAVHLEDGDTIHICSAERAVARRLALHLFGAAVRVYGDGTWRHDANAKWNLEGFRIKGFRKLDDSPLTELTKVLRKINGSEWSALEDPYAELMRLRDPN